MNKNNFFFKVYYWVFDFIAKERLERKCVERRDVHTLLFSVLTTNWIMWLFTAFSYNEMASPYPHFLGFIFATIHLLSPLLFKMTGNMQLASTVMLASGLIHQFVFSFYSGGFTSQIIAWIAAPPLFAGFLIGMRGAISWSFLSLAYLLFFLILDLNNYNFPDLLSPHGHMMAHGGTVFSWLLLNTIFIICFLKINGHSAKLQNEQNKKIDDLFRVLFHDLANPLGRIGIGLSICKKQNNSDQTKKGLDIASQAADSMIEITQNVRKIYAVSKGRVEIPLTFFNINEAIEYVIKVYEAELGQKDIKVSCDFEKWKNIKILVEPVSFKNQVLANIVSNAIKFSPSNSEIKINVFLLDEKVILEVTDQGIGMPEAILSNLFDLTKKTARKGTHGEIGTGFGMHIMKSFVEMYNGEVDVVSKDAKQHTNSGTTLKLILDGKIEDRDEALS